MRSSAYVGRSKSIVVRSIILFYSRARRNAFASTRRMARRPCRGRVEIVSATREKRTLQ